MVVLFLKSSIETTAHTLAATLGFLALNQDVQDEVFEQIKEVVGYGRDPVSFLLSILALFIYFPQEIEDYHNLNKVLAAFFEALRLFRKNVSSTSQHQFNHFTSVGSSHDS